MEIISWNIYIYYWIPFNHYFRTLRTYSRWPLSDGTFGATFIATKSRVASLKQLTIPQLELQAAVLATHLGKTIVEESRFQLEKVVYFLDSMIALAWIRLQARSFKTFVSTRIGEIESNSDPAE